ncbi:hypothetical protein PG985_003292 [Apiospora marii]|uniref:uncharacterized protein n=1 Tax=Apiospora marii TaxID=335849 RepID=UPI00312F836E
MSPSIRLILLSGAAFAAQKQCYFPHKNVHSLGIPCDPDAEGPVPCCEATHTCLSNKLCWDTKWNHILRGGCTDPLFKDPACPHLCEQEAQGGGLAFLRQCNGRFDDWTCVDDLDVTDCNLPFTIQPGLVKDYRPSNVSNVIYANANTTRDSGTGLSSSETQGNLQQAKLQVGLGAGLGVGLPLLVALALSLWSLRRTQQELKQLRRDQSSSSTHAARLGEQRGTGQIDKPEDPTPNTEGYSTGPPPVYRPAQYMQASSQQQPAPPISHQPS